MADVVYDAPVYGRNSSEISETECACCDNIKLELQRTLTELISAQRIIEMLQEELDLVAPTRTVSKDACNLHHEGNFLQTEFKMRDWIHVPASRRTRNGKPKVNNAQPIPTIVNRYDLLHNLNQPQNISRKRRMEVMNKIYDGKIKITTGRKHKVLIIGDSHARGCAAEVSSNLNEHFDVSGLVMPGSNLESITNMAKKEITTLTKNDLIVVWGGTNDISKNESSKGLTNISNFVQSRGHTNIIIMSAPHRHDLDTASCINNEVKIFNRKLLKKLKIYDYACVVETNLDREHFTQHGLHMNRFGKKSISKIISENIKLILIKKMCKIFSNV
jgi:hypothetical protein